MGRLRVGDLDLDVPDGQLTERLGIELIEVGPDRLVGTMPVTGNLQPYGLLHGGATMALGETLGSVAAALHAGAQRVAVGIEMSATHHRAARSGLVTGLCTPIHRGNTLATFDIKVHDDADRLLCTMRLSCLIRDRPPGS